MKRIAMLCVILTLLCSVTACGANPPAATQGNTPAGTTAPIVTDGAVATHVPQESEGKEAETPKVLVAYFSCTGTTERLATYVAEATGGELYGIEPIEPYSAEDLDYTDAASRANREQNDGNARPAIVGSVSHMENYDIIFIGYPIWHGKAPRIISTFLESYDFADKTIVPFCTSQSSGMGSSATDLHDLCAGTASWLAGERFAAETSKEAVVAWLGGLGLEIPAR